MLVCIANGEDPGQITCVQNFRTSTVTSSPVGQLPMQSGVIFHAFVDFQNISFKNTIRVSNCLDPGQDRHPDLGPNCL